MSQVEERIANIRDLLSSGKSFDFERMLQSHYERFLVAGDSVIDVGAHTGRHLAKFIQCVGRSGTVFAFEPLSFAFDLLKERYGKLVNVKIENVALSDVAGIVDFVHARGTPEESGLRQRIYNSPETANPVVVSVECAMLDDYIDQFTKVDYIKIDVEGGEINVLRGAESVLRAFRPIVSVEYGFPGYSSYGHSLYTLFDFADSHGFVMYDIFLHRLSRSEWPMSCDAICWDFFMVPGERERDFALSLGI